MAKTKNKSKASALSVRNLECYQFSVPEKQFLFEKYKQTKSLKDAQELFAERFPLTGVPSCQLIHKLYLSFQKKELKIHHTDVENNNKINRKKLPVQSQDRNSGVLKRVLHSKLSPTFQFKKSKKRKKSKLKKLNKLLAKRLANKTNLSNASLTQSDQSQNIEGMGSFENVLNFSSTHQNTDCHTSQFDNVDCSKIKNITRSKRKRTLEEDHENQINRETIPVNKKIDVISLLSPIPDKMGDPALCQIDLTRSPRLIEVENENKEANKIPSSSTPFFINRFKSLKPQTNINTNLMANMISPIPKKVKVLEAPASTLAPEIILDDEDPGDYVTIDKVGSSTMGSNITVIELDEENSLIQPESSNSENTVVKTKEKDIEYESLSSIDLTEDCLLAELKENDNTVVQNKKYECYDLTLDNSDSTVGKSMNTLINRRSQILNALAYTVLGNSFTPNAVQNVPKRVNKNGSNIYNPRNNFEPTGLRMVVIDGSNVAMGHKHGKCFSVEGLQICIDYFLKRGHEVKAFVPRFRNRRFKSSNPRLLDQLEAQGHVVYTPSREIKGKFIASYDDRYIVQYAAEYEGVIVSGDNFRDLLLENKSWKETIEQRLLPFTWVGDMLMFPQDPLGKTGPSLSAFLSHPDPKKL